MKQIWDDFSQAYVHQQSNMNQFAFSLLNQVNFNECQRFIDVGCGACFVHPQIISLLQPQAELFGIDISPNMIKLGYQFMQKQGYLITVNEQGFEIPNKQYKIIQGSCEELKFESNYFDVYFSNLTLYLSNQVKTLEEAYRVLKNKGRLVFNYWGQADRCDMLCIVAEVLNQHGAEINIKGFDSNIEKIIETLNKVGFKNIKYWYQDSALNIIDSKELVKISPLPFRNIIYNKQQNEQNIIYQEIQNRMNLKFEKDQPLIQQALMIICDKL